MVPSPVTNRPADLAIPAPSAPSHDRPSFLTRLKGQRELGVFSALLVMVIILAIGVPQFHDPANLVNITRNFSFVGIVSLGMTLVIITGGIDLSVGSVWGVTAVITATMLASGWSLPVAIPVGLLCAAVVGLFNGFCIIKLMMSPFVPTLATLSIARSLALIITHGRPISDFGPSTENFLKIGGGDLFGIPNPVLIFAAMGLLFWALLSGTVWGRHVYAVGGNERAAKLTGLNVNRLKLTVYVLSSVCAGIAGIVQASYLSSVTASLATGQELFVIAAAVIGGTNLAGGEGSIPGVVIGAIILEVLRNGLLLFGIDPYWQGVFVGAVIVLAVSIDYLRKRLHHE